MKTERELEAGQTGVKNRELKKGFFVEVNRGEKTAKRQ
jgi:hypothetical protein